MTITNTGFNPFPSSCALNSQLYSNNNCGWNGSGFKRCSSDTPVPEAKPYCADSRDYWNGIHVPHQNQIPMGQEGTIGMMPEFNKDIIRCSDGTLINTKTRQVINHQENSDGCWGNGTVKYPTERENCWNDSEINQINVNQNPFCNEPMSKDDIEYQKYSEMRNREIMNNQSDLQKQLLRDLENGRFSSKSRLIEESKKPCQ